MSELALQRIEEEKKNRTGRLDLGNSGMRVWPEKFFECTWLDTLIISDIFVDFRKLSIVKNRVEGPENFITYLPEQINRLEKLKIFICSGIYENRWEIKHFPDLSGLKKLEYLNLNFNQIEKIENLKALTGLQILYLETNKIKRIENLEASTGLKKLNLVDNQIKKIENLENPTGLQHLILANNQIKEINDLEMLNNIDSVFLYGNPIRNIPKALLSGGSNNNCLPNLKSWFRDLEKSGAKENKTIKLFINGNGNAGKTSLVKALQSSWCKEEPESTHGVIITSLNISQHGEELRFVIWDFGGQEIYHSTHRLFLSSEAVHLIVTDTRTEELAVKNEPIGDRITGEQMRHFPVGYWIDTVKEFSPESPIILVQNKIDESSVIQRDVEKLQSDPLVKHFVKVSATESDGIDVLKTSLFEQARKLNEYNFKMPASWARARDYFLNILTDEELTQRTITKEKFTEICVHKYKVMGLSIDAFITFLHHTGVIYADQKYLGDTLVFDQTWALEAIYKPFERGSLFYNIIRNTKNGLVNIESLFQVFGSAYDEDQKWLFLKLTMSCQVCFKVNDGEDLSESSVLVFPEFLQEKPPKSVTHIWDSKKNDALLFRRRYRHLDYY